MKPSVDEKAETFLEEAVDGEHKMLFSVKWIINDSRLLSRSPEGGPGRRVGGGGTKANQSGSNSPLIPSKYLIIRIYMDKVVISEARWQELRLRVELLFALSWLLVTTRYR